MRYIVASLMFLYFVSMAICQGEPPSCVDFDQNAASVKAMTPVVQQISEADFREAEKHATAVQNPSKVFEVGTIHYFEAMENGQPQFNRSTNFPDKEADFLKSYNADARVKLFFYGSTCVVAYAKQMGETIGYQKADIVGKLVDVIGALNQASETKIEAQDELIQTALKYIVSLSNEIEALKDRYNSMVARTNAYNDAVNEYVNTVNEIMVQRRVSAPRIQFNFVRQQPITCTGNTTAFSNSLLYPGSVDTMTTANTTVECR